MKTKIKRTAFSNKVTGVLNFADLKKRRYRVLYYAMFLFLLIISLTCLIPVIWTAFSGFKSVEEMYAIPPTFFPKKIDFGNVFDVLSKVNILKYIKNSVILIIGCLACDIFINGLAGYVLSRLRPSGSKIINTLIFWSMLLPGISMITLYMTFVDMPILHINLLGTFIPLCIMAGASAFDVLLFKSFFDGIPMAYLEAARIDGCSDVGIFTKIILPLSKPIISVVSIFNIIGTWGNFMWPYLIVGNTDKEPIAVALYQINMNGKLMQNEYMILMFLSILPMIIVFCIFSKHIMGGINIGGIKG